MGESSCFVLFFFLDFFLINRIGTPCSEDDVLINPLAKFFYSYFFSCSRSGLERKYKVSNCNLNTSSSLILLL